jgi:hypothetical protein
VKILKRFSIVLALTVALCLAFVGSAYANFGPHGGYINDTDACAGCHRAHTSFSTVGWKDGLGTQHASALLVGNAATMTEFCDACHGDQAPGASTNVQSGIFDAGPSDGTGATSLTPAVNSPTMGSVGHTYTNGANLLPSPPGPGNFPGDSASVVAQYLTASTFGAPLNGGGFDRMPDPYAWQGTANGGTGAGGVITFVKSTSAHQMDVTGPLWGSGSAVSTFGGTQGLTCTDCHDPHGSSNYRLLKAKPNPAGPVVGGYASDGETPNAFVFSNEVGYPIPAAVFSTGNPGGGVAVPGYPNGGWLKHAAGAAQVAAYRPNYTKTSGSDLLHTEASLTSTTQSMSVWCSACHMNYNQSSAGNAVNYNYNPWLPGNGNAATPGNPAGALGAKDYHRHAVDQNMAAGYGSSRALAEQVVSSPQWVPLENPGFGDATDFSKGYIGCLTCHRAHGSSVSMSGWANAHLVNTPNSNSPSGFTYIPVEDTVMGVDPDKGVYNGSYNQGTSSLLRANNRGVCERCHNK